MLKMPTTIQFLNQEAKTGQVPNRIFKEVNQALCSLLSKRSLKLLHSDQLVTCPKTNTIPKDSSLLTSDLILKVMRSIWVLTLFLTCLNKMLILTTLPLVLVICIVLINQPRQLIFNFTIIALLLIKNNFLPMKKIVVGDNL